MPAVVCATLGGHIHELVLKGSWQDRDLTAAAGLQSRIQTPVSN